MGLSCYWGFDFEPGCIMIGQPSDLAPLDRKRPAKCCSCKAALAPRAPAAKFPRYKFPEHDIEIRIYGEDGESGPPRAPWFMCPDCWNLYLFLERFDYAIDIGDDMRELSKEHAELVRAGKAGCL